MKKIKITNTSGVKLEFFVKIKDSEDKLISLEPGTSCFSDGLETTKSIRIFERKGLLKVDRGEYQTTEDFSNAFIEEVSHITPSIIPNATPDSDEILDDLHTTKSIQIEIPEEKSLKEDLLKFHNIGDEELDQIKKDMSEQITQEASVSADWALENVLGIDPASIANEFKDALNPTMQDIKDSLPPTDEHTTKNNLLEEAEKQAKEYKEEDEKKQYKYNYKKKPGRKKKRGPKAGAKKKKLKEEKNKEDNSSNQE